MDRLLGLLIAMGILSLIFGVIEWRWPSVRQKRARKGFFTDLAWWLFTPTAGRAFSTAFVAIVFILGSRLLGLGLSVEELRNLADRDTAVTRQPVLVQLAGLLLIADFFGYWQHRAFHTFEKLWRIHAVHHSSTELDWLSSVRVHPLNEAVSNTVIAAPLLLLGFSGQAVAAFIPFLTFYAIALHANVNWTFGPLRYVLASPVFHRWHHSANLEALDKNFAGLLPLWDILFGSFYMPKDRVPANFGVAGNPVPGGFIAQLLYPFRRPKPAPVAVPAIAG